MKKSRLILSPNLKNLPHRLSFGLLLTASLLTGPVWAHAANAPEDPTLCEILSAAETILEPSSATPILLAAALEKATPQPEMEPPRPPHPDDAHARDRDGEDDGERRGGGRRVGRGGGGDELEMLERLLAMPPEQLSRVRRAVEQMEAMSPEEREALRERLRDYRKISPEERQKMREKWRELSPEERRDFVRKMRERRLERVFEHENQNPAKEPTDD